MRRAVLWAMVPGNLLLLVWVWIGRIVFGVGGWFVLILAPFVALFGLGLLVTTVLALTQPGRPRSLTHAQAFAQLVTWAGMLGCGAFMPDFGDTDDSTRSLLTQVFGYSDTLFSASFAVAIAFAVVALLGWLSLLVLLVARRRTAVGA